MDEPWDAVAPDHGGYLNEFSDDLLLNLDTETLNVLTSHAPEGAGSSKRQKVDDQPASLSNFLSRIQNDDGTEIDTFEVAESSKSDGEEDVRGKGKRELSQAAKNKACRERARRERLNEGFTELSKLIDPGKQVKPDKASIVADAVRVISQLRAENNQLKQLNKFLEEKVSEAEKQKGQSLLQAMFQQQATLQQQQQQQVMLAPQPHVLSQQFIAAGVPVGMLPQPYPSVPGISNAPNMGQLPTMPGVQGMMSLDASGKPHMQGFPQAPGAAMPPMTSWLPPSTLDISQDHKLRPPAA